MNASYATLDNLKTPGGGSAVRYSGKLIVSTLLFVGGDAGCVMPECSQPNYTEPECRVRLENEVARAALGSGFEVRFQHPQANTTTSWDARGVVQTRGGAITARIAGPGDFAISVERTRDNAPMQLTLLLTNIAPQVVVQAGPNELLSDLGSSPTPGLSRTVTLDFTTGNTQWIRGQLPCPERFRLAVTADIQTGRAQLTSILEALSEESLLAEADGEPLLGLVILGDLSEWTDPEEFDDLVDIFAQASIPIAVTPGNHDVLDNSSSPFHQAFGPGNHEFSVCGAKVVLLDSGSGGLARSVEGRLDSLLDRGDNRFLLVGTHYPPYPHFSGDGWTREDQSQHLMAAFATRQGDLLLAGHNHALADFPFLEVAGRTIHEIIVGTGGADQGAGPPRFGYLRLTFDDTINQCFVEVPPPGAAGPLHAPPSQGMPYCEP